MTNEMEARVTQVTIMPKGGHIFDELAYTIEIQDEAAGEYLSLEDSDGRVHIDKKDWPILREQLDKMFKDVRE